MKKVELAVVRAFRKRRSFVYVNREDPDKTNEEVKRVEMRDDLTRDHSRSDVTR